MRRRGHIVTVIGIPLFFVYICSTIAAQGQRAALSSEPPDVRNAQDHRPPLFFKETWKPPTAAQGQSCDECNQKTQKLVTPEFVDSPNLEVRLYGPAAKQLIVTQRAAPKDDPTFIWSGLATANWLVMLRDKTNNVDLSSPVAKIRWRTYMNGFNLLRPVIKLADGTFLVGDKTEPESADWHESELLIADIHWRVLEPETVTLARGSPWKDNPDLTQVEEVGFTDMTRSRRYSGGLTRLDYLEVYGNPVRRDGQSKR